MALEQNRAHKRLVLNLINRSTDQPFSAEIGVPGRRIKAIRGEELGGGDLKTMNTFEAPQKLIPHEIETVKGGTIQIAPKTVGVYQLSLD